jgi:hypothetical protein
MIFSQAQGNRERREVRGINASAEVLLEAPERRWTLDSVLFANTSGSSVNITLDINDGVNTTILLPAKALAAHDVYLFKDHNIIINAGETLRVTASTADVIDATASAFYGNTTG